MEGISYSLLMRIKLTLNEKWIIYCANFIKKTGNIGSIKSPSQRQSPSTQTHFSTCTVSLFTSHPSTNAIPDRKRSSQLNNRPVTISFSSPSPTILNSFLRATHHLPTKIFLRTIQNLLIENEKLSNDTTSIVSLNTHTKTESTTET